MYSSTNKTQCNFVLLVIDARANIIKKNINILTTYTLTFCSLFFFSLPCQITQLGDRMFSLELIQIRFPSK